MAFHRQTCALLSCCCRLIGLKKLAYRRTAVFQGLTTVRPFLNSANTSVVTSCHTANYSQQSSRGSENHREAEAKEDQENDKPVKYSTSRAATWTVDNSYGSHHQKPLKVVIPVSLFWLGLLSWAVFRKETEIDEWLDDVFSGRLPERYADDQEQQFESLEDWTKRLKEEKMRNDSYQR